VHERPGVQSLFVVHSSSGERHAKPGSMPQEPAYTPAGRSDSPWQESERPVAGCDPEAYTSMMATGPVTQRSTPPQAGQAGLPQPDIVRADSNAPEQAISPEELAAAWDAWVKSGPQGPLDDDGDPAFP
jgi:hypothetical protein